MKKDKPLNDSAVSYLHAQASQDIGLTAQEAFILFGIKNLPEFSRLYNKNIKGDGGFINRRTISLTKVIDRLGGTYIPHPRIYEMRDKIIVSEYLLEPEKKESGKAALNDDNQHFRELYVEHFLSGKPLTNAEAFFMFGIKNLPGLVKSLIDTHSEFTFNPIIEFNIPMEKAFKRMNACAEGVVCKPSPVLELVCSNMKVTSYRIKEVPHA